MDNKKSISVLILFGLGALFSCGAPDKADKKLLREFMLFDTFLRTRPFHYDSVKMFLEDLDQSFIYSESRQLSYDERKTTVHYKWNADSSTTMLNANKIFTKGSSREIIVHSGDSILFVYRFSTQPLGLEDSDHFTFLESVYYLAKTGTINHVARVQYGKTDLKDTVEFRKLPFTNLTDGISHYYSLELDYSKNILTLN